MARHRVTVQEAAGVLGFSVDAVRQRIRRGQLERAEPEDPADNRVYVWLNLDKQSLDLNRTLSLSTHI